MQLLRSTGIQMFFACKNAGLSCELTTTVANHTNGMYILACAFR